MNRKTELRFCLRKAELLLLLTADAEGKTEDMRS